MMFFIYFSHGGRHKHCLMIVSFFILVLFCLLKLSAMREDHQVELSSLLVDLEDENTKVISMEYCLAELRREVTLLEKYFGCTSVSV